MLSLYVVLPLTANSFMLFSQLRCKDNLFVAFLIEYEYQKSEKEYNYSSN